MKAKRFIIMIAVVTSIASAQDASKTGKPQQSKVPVEQKLALEKATNDMLRAQINILISNFRIQCEKQQLTLGPDQNGDLDCIAKQSTVKPPVGKIENGPVPAKKDENK